MKTLLTAIGALVFGLGLGLFIGAKTAPVPDATACIEALNDTTEIFVSQTTQLESVQDFLVGLPEIVKRQDYGLLSTKLRALGDDAARHTQVLEGSSYIEHARECYQNVTVSD